MEDILDLCKEITSDEYVELKNPTFLAQTRADESGTYWMVFESEGIYYKVQDNLRRN